MPKCTSYVFRLLLLLTLMQGSLSAAEQHWPNLDEDEAVHTEMILPPESEKEIEIKASAEMMVSVHGKLFDQGSAGAFDAYSLTDEFPLEMIPLSKEGWPVGAGLAGGGTLYTPVNNSITLKIKNRSPVKLRVAIVLPK